MTAFADEPAHAARTRNAATLPMWLITTAAAVFAAALIVLMFWPRFVAVWRHGAFYDTDDAMRLVQVRGLLAGQSWYDMTVYRLDPPSGSFMHWSRVVDTPLALLIDLFRPFSGQATAEILARLVFPFALSIALFLGVARLADTLLGSVARLPAIATALLTGAAIIQFQPGRIDHHAPQIVTLVFMVGAALAALDPTRARLAALAGALAALSLAISLENLPFIACLACTLVICWVWHGPAMARMLRWFGFGLLASLLPFFLATVRPDHWFAPVCDAFGAAHLGAGMIGAVGCVALSAGVRTLWDRPRRLAAACALAGVALAYVALAYPACLHDPFHNVDPLVRDIWIANVRESFSFLRLFHEERTLALLSLLPVVLGLAGTLVAALRLRGATALRFAVLSALIATGLAMAFWQVRVFTSVAPLAACGALPLAVLAHDRVRKTGRDLMAILALFLVLPFTAVFWALALPDDPPKPARDTACFAPAAYAPIAALPEGRVLAPIDAGSFLLAHTAMSVFAAPYHRNNDGNRFALDAFLATPAQAEKRVRARGTTYVMICPGLHETDMLARRAPTGLAAALLAAHPPAWLTPVVVADTPFRVFRVDAPDK